LGDEVNAFASMHADDPGWLALLHFLVSYDQPLDQCLRAVRGDHAPERDEAARIAIERFAPRCCGMRLARLADSDLADAPDQRFALAVALGWIRVSGGNSVLPIWVHK